MLYIDYGEGKDAHNEWAALLDIPDEGMEILGIHSKLSSVWFPHLNIKKELLEITEDWAFEVHKDQVNIHIIHV